MSGVELLQLSTSNPVDPFWRKSSLQSEDDSPFHYAGWRTFTNFAKRRRDTDPYSGKGSGYGGRFVFRPDKTAFLRGATQLILDRSALTVQGNGTFARFVDYEGFMAIKQIDIKYGSNTLYTVTGDQMLIDHKDRELRQQQMTEEIVFGNRSVAERDALAASPQVLIIDLFSLPYTKNPSRYLPLTAIAHELEIQVQLQPLSLITQTDSTTAYPTCTINNLTLRTLDIHLMNDERNYIHQKTLNKEGINYRIVDWEQQTEQLQAGQTIYNINLTNLKGPAIEFIFTLRRQSDMLGTLPTASQSFTNFQDLSSWLVQAGSIIVIDEHDSRYCRFYLNPLYHSSYGGDLIFRGSFSLDTESDYNVAGHKTFASMVTPKLVIKFATALATNLQLDIYIRTNNLWQLAAGEIKRIWT